MRRGIAVLLAACCLAGPAWGGDRSVTLYLDGARMEVAVATGKGSLEYPLPAETPVGSLRVKPLGVAKIGRVEVVPVKPDAKLEKSLAALTERKELLTDRLKALDTKEETFRAAAKSQSGKAPRKSKSNPEPLENLRQGTEFAFGQLEGVYRARRKTDNELKQVEASLQSLRERGNVGGNLVRIWLTGRDGRVQVSYLVPSLRWVPFYQFRLDGAGNVALTLHARLPALEKGATVAVVLANQAGQTAETPLRQVAETYALVNEFTLPVTNEQSSTLPNSWVAFTLTNGSGQALPPGEAAGYRQGEYLGTTPFPGCGPGETLELAFGR